MFALTIALIFTMLPEQGTIAFIAHTDDSTRLCLYDVAADSVTALGPGRDDREPRWSPDGSMIAFTTLDDGQRQIALAHPDEKRIEILKNGKMLNQAPRWNVSGDKLAYQSGTLGDTTVAVYDQNTNTETTWGGGVRGLMRPVWTTTADFILSPFLNIPERERQITPDHTHMLLAVQLLEHPESGLWTTRLVAVTPKKLYPLNNWVYASPEEGYLEWNVELGDRDRALAYESNDGGDRELFVALSGKVFDVSNHREADWNPVWSPDSKWIAYETFRNRRRAIFRSHRGSGRSLPMAQSGSANFFEPSWHPDSESIVAVREQGGKVELVLSTVDDSELRVLATPYEQVSAPQWRPR